MRCDIHVRNDAHKDSPNRYALFDTMGEGVSWQLLGPTGARAGAFGSKVVILDEPTAALGVRETGQVLKLIRELRDNGLAIILISHNMPNVFEVADRIHIQRLGACAGVISPKTHSMEDAVAIMTGAKKLTAAAD